MTKIETTLSTVHAQIRNFYRADQHHFMVMNAVDMGPELEIQWFFCDYAPPAATTCFFIRMKPEELIPTIRDIVPSAWVAEAELTDLMNIQIEQTAKGFVLEPDFEAGPLRKKK